MRDGVIADYLTTEAMLRYFIGLIAGRFNLVRPEIMVTIPAGVTSVEQRAVRDAAEQAGARKPAHLIPEPLAAAIGAQLPIASPRGTVGRFNPIAARPSSRRTRTRPAAPR